MIYVLQVAPHEENQIENIFREFMPSSLCQRFFHPMRRISKKFHGEWVETSEKLLPGYVFVETNEPEEFYKRLKTIPRLTKMLGKSYNDSISAWEFIGLSVEETEWLENIMSCGENNEVKLSCVKRDEFGNIKVISGPLLYLADKVKKIDLHRRIAKVELSFGQKQSLLYFGIEIVD